MEESVPTLGESDRGGNRGDLQRSCLMDLVIIKGVAVRRCCMSCVGFGCSEVFTRNDAGLVLGSKPHSEVEIRESSAR